MQITETLEQRGSQYGNFATQAVTAQMLKDVMRNAPNWDALTADKRESLELIATKISRILHGDTEHHDNFHDIAGYATLIADTLTPG